MPGSEPASQENPLVAAILEGTAPPHLKSSAARGVLPISRADLARVLVALTRDDDASIRHDAGDSLGSFPDEEMLELLGDAATAPEVLEHFAKRQGIEAEFVDAILRNPATPVGALRAMAPNLDADRIDTLLLNQTRLIESPDLLELLMSNAASTALQRSRFEEIRRHFLETAEPITRAEPEPQPVAPPPEPPRAPDPDATATEPGKPGVIETTEDENPNQKIMRLNTAQKIQLAFKGNREERAILIRDSSKSVQTAVLESPKISEPEIESFAKNRSCSEEVLRSIAGNREWMKNYVVVHALVGNPKTPVGIAMTLVSRLNNRDLKNTVTDKNIPEAIRRQARKVTEARNARTQRKF